VNAGAISVYPPDKDALPKGRLSDHYEDGVLFVTYRCACGVVVCGGVWCGVGWVDEGQVQKVYASREVSH